jgi:hypothetical protein
MVTIEMIICLTIETFRRFEMFAVILILILAIDGQTNGQNFCVSYSSNSQQMIVQSIDDKLLFIIDRLLWSLTLSGDQLVFDHNSGRESNLGKRSTTAFMAYEGGSPRTFYTGLYDVSTSDHAQSPNDLFTDGQTIYYPNQLL